MSEDRFFDGFRRGSIHGSHDAAGIEIGKFAIAPGPSRAAGPSMSSSRVEAAAARGLKSASIWRLSRRGSRSPLVVARKSTSG